MPSLIKKTPQDDPQFELHKNAVSMWMKRVQSAQRRQKDIFEEMRASMRFAAGYQWAGQKKRNESRYTANFCTQEVNRKVSQLYARNPTAEYKRRKRLDFQIYDGKLESVQGLLAAAQAHPMGMAGLPLEGRALLLDFSHGIEERQYIDKVGETMQIAFQYLLDEQDDEEGEFTQQMKQLVRRVVTSKVGYVRIAYTRDEQAQVTTAGLGNTVMSKASKVAYLTEKVNNGEIDENSEKFQSLQNLAIGLGGTLTDRLETGTIRERIVYDALPSTSVLVDPRCTCLKGFIGAQWVAIEYCLPKDDVQALFGVELSSPTTKDVDYTARNRESNPEPGEEVMPFYEILDKQSRTHFFVCDSYHGYLQEPELLTPQLRGFWPIGALTFNDVEVDPSRGMSPFPPSDVELLMPIQKEWNRTREELKKHRKANGPKWMTKKGMLTDEDKDKLEAAETNAVVEIQGVPAGESVASVFAPIPSRPIEPAVYDTAPMMQDILVTTGSQQNLPEAVQARATATGQTIEANKQMTVTASNVDDLDALLTWIAKCSGQIMLKEFSLETMRQIVGPGAVWPTDNHLRQGFLNMIYLTTKAASSGRPNKAVEMSNWRIAAPVLQAAGANPQFIVRETLRRLDEDIDAEDAFPLMPTGNPAANLPPSVGQHQPGDQEAHEPGVNLPPEQSRPGPGVMQGQQNNLPQLSGSVAA